MISRRIILQTLLSTALAASAYPTLAAAQRPSAISSLDTDNDGTVDLDEAKRAAAAVFDRLDRDHDGTLDSAELAGRLSAREFRAADPDHDGTVSRDEYLAIVEQRFKAADTDHEGTLDARELRSAAGKSLLKLLR